MRGSQQDIDLVLVHELGLILVEAKWFGAWSEDQLEAKLKRLSLFTAHADEVCKAADVRQITTHLLLMSPTKPPARINDLWTIHGRGEKPNG